LVKRSKTITVCAGLNVSIRFGFWRISSLYWCSKKIWVQQELTLIIVKKELQEKSRKRQIPLLSYQDCISIKR
jgi:hypothetical protein